MKRLNWIVFLLAIVLSGCGSSSSDDPAFKPETTSVNSLTLVDALGQPLSNASVVIESNETSNTSSDTSNNLVYHLTQTASTDANGQLITDDLPPGEYTISITQNGVTVVTTLMINDENASQDATLAAPLIQDGDNTVSLQDSNGENTAIFASISGVIYDAAGPVTGAQVALSGGSETNGAVALDITDEDGAYLLIINVSLSKLSAMESATLRVTKEGYSLFEVSFDVTAALAFAGQNVALSTAGNISAIYEEDFEQVLDGAVCGAWVAQDLDSYEYEQFTEVPAELDMTNLWHQHDTDLLITNAALSEGLVNLAPDDTSEGVVPNPLDQHGCWYGQSASGNLGQGNFLGDLQESYPDPEGYDLGDGGTSLRANGGAIVSPVLDFTAQQAPLALTFKTWWEIESVNPNENGFDLMIIETSVDGGATWSDLARLNPLADPETDDIDRSPIPFSSRGFNRAPEWVDQEPIDISGLAGQSNAKIRFVFLTQDEFYNGFRGWLIDDIKILPQAGSFPLYEADNAPICQEPNEDCSDFQEQ